MSFRLLRDFALSTLHIKVLSNSPRKYFILSISHSLPSRHFRAHTVPLLHFGHSILSLDLRAFTHTAWHWTWYRHLSCYFHLSVCSRNSVSSARRRRHSKFITVIVSWQGVSGGRVDYGRSRCASLFTLPLPGLVMPQSTLETVNELIAGSFGGAAQVLVGQPLDTIKTRSQIAPSSVSFFYVMGSLPHHA
jgi:hypothetical protein